MAPKFAIQTIFEAVDRLTGPTRTMTGSIQKFSANAGKGISGLTSGVSRLRGLLVSAAAIMTTGAVARAITDFAQRGDEIGRTARTLGLTAEALQELQYAAKLADLPAEDLTAAFKKMNNNLGQLKASTGSLYTNLKKTNPQLALQLKHAKDSDAAFTLLMDAISKETDVSKRAALTQAAFGKAGQNLIEMANGGAEALNALRKAAHDSGSIITNEGVTSAEAFDESLKKMTSSIAYLKNSALEELMKALAPVLDAVLAWVKANREMLRQKIHDAVGKIVEAAKRLYAIVEKVWQAWDRLNKLDNGHLARDILIVAAAWKALTVAINIAKAAQIAFNLVSLAGKGGAVAGAAAGAAEGAIGSGAAKWAGRFAGGGAAALGAGASFIPVVGAAVAMGSAMLPMATNPTGFLESSRTGKGMEGGNFLTNLLAKVYGLGAAVRGGKKDEPAKVQIDFSGMPAGVSVRSSSSSGVGLNLGPASVKHYAAATGGRY
jgi:hypothetical protein